MDGTCDQCGEIGNWCHCDDLSFNNGKQGGGLNLREFSKANLARCESSQGFNHSLKSWSTSDWLTATVGELGEAANIAKKLNRVRDGVKGNKESPEELRQEFTREIADTFIYLDLLAQSVGVDLSDAVTKTFNEKSVQIGYPNTLEAK